VSHKVLVTDPIDNAALLELKAQFDVTIHLNLSREDLVSLIKDIDILVMRSSIAVDIEVLKHAEKLKIIA